MKTILRRFVPQWPINTFKHRPTAFIANLKHGRPSRKLKIIGVTGTDGKTTTTNMIFQILKSAGKKASMISTIGAEIGGEKFDIGFHLTSPSPFALQKYLKQAVGAGSEYMVLETTSHALDQHRVGGIKFDVGVITNITQDHFDYHKNFNNYFKAKAKIIKNVKFAILNRDEDHYRRLSQKTSGKVLSFGFANKADFNPHKFPLKLKIPGQYNMLNGLAAAAACKALGIDTSTIQKTLSKFAGLTGRMEEIPNNKDLRIIIDFAHTPNALLQALKTLRSQYKHGNLISVFGSAGRRDEKKRPMMGEIVQRNSDLVVVTAEDPRGEFKKITEQIINGSKAAGGKLDKDLFVREDRQEAINFAINTLAKKGDTVGIFGKGHEKSMNLDGKTETPWNDKEAVLKALNGNT